MVGTACYLHVPKPDGKAFSFAMGHAFCCEAQKKEEDRLATKANRIPWNEMDRLLVRYKSTICFSFAV